MRAWVVLVLLVFFSSGCIEVQDGKVIIDFNAIKGEKSTIEQTSITDAKSLCEKNIKDDIELRKKIAQFPFKIVHVDITLVNSSEEALNWAKNLGVLYDYIWFREYPDGKSYLGIGIVEITEGQFLGTRGYYYYGCDVEGNIIIKQPKLIA